MSAISGVLANELAPCRIRVSVAGPGLVVTEGMHAGGFVARTPLGRVGHLDDIASVVAFLATDDARWMNGEEITASGGLR